MSDNSSIIGSGPAWYRAIRDLLLPTMTESHSARRTFCQKGTESLKNVRNELIDTLQSRTLNWEFVHKKTHEAWELDKLIELLCEPWAMTIPTTETVKKKPKTKPKTVKAKLKETTEQQKII